jgi:hypothetical protein
MKKAKLFVIQVSKGGKWDSECLYKGDLGQAMRYTERTYGHTGSRVVRVKTPAEYEKYAVLETLGEGFAITEWTN